MKRLLSLALCAAITLSGCSSVEAGAPSSSSSASQTPTQAPTQDLTGDVTPTDIVEETQEPVHVESMGTLKRASTILSMIEDSEQNTLFSPLSLEMALGLLSEGAVGATREQLTRFLGYESYNVVARVILNRAEDATFESEMYEGYNTVMSLANSLWLDNKYTLKDDYFAIAQESYDATSETLDFKNGANAAGRINDWCSEKTRGLINELVAPETFTAEMALILCNSLYFESAWRESWKTREGTFTDSLGETHQLNDMLYSTEDIYYSTEGAVAFGKKYMSGMTFIGILPNEGVSIGDINLEWLLASESRDYDVECSMPKLNYDTTCSQLVPILQSLGVSNIFDKENGELSGIVNESEDLYVSDIIQKCKIELDENGTKAAAVTGIMISDNAAFVPVQREIKEVHLDRPFYYMIMDEVTGTVLFIGSVNTVE